MSNTNSKDTNFSENQIRPDRFENGNLRARDEDIKRLKTNIDKFIDVNCPACGSKNNNFEFTKFDFNFVKCQKCNTVFMNPRPTKEILNEFILTPWLIPFGINIYFLVPEKLGWKKYLDQG